MPARSWTARKPWNRSAGGYSKKSLRWRAERRPAANWRGSAMRNSRPGFWGRRFRSKPISPRLLADRCPGSLRWLDLERRNHFVHALRFQRDSHGLGHFLITGDRAGQGDQSVGRVHVDVERGDARFREELRLDGESGARVGGRVHNDGAGLLRLLAHDEAGAGELLLDVLGLDIPHCLLDR